MQIINNELIKVNEQDIVNFEISVPDNVTRISKYAFLNLINLKSVVLSKNLTHISKDAFKGCYNLSKVSFPPSLKIIEEGAFKDCNLIDQVILPKKLEKVERNAFLFENFSYLIGKGDELILTNSKFKSEDFIQIDLTDKPRSLIKMLITNFDDKEQLLKDFTKEESMELNNILYSFLSKEDFSKFVKDKNLKFYKQFNLSSLTREEKINFIKFYYNLGGFLSPLYMKQEKNGKQNIKLFDYAQFVGETLKDLILKGLDLKEFCSKLDGISLREFNSELTAFILNKQNFNEILQISQNDCSFISKIFGYFEKVQDTNTSNKGRQRQLSPTVEKFYNYFKENKFFGVTKANRDIAQTISPYFNNQSDFMCAVEIMKEKQENNVPDNILQDKIEDENLLNIDALYENIFTLNKNTLNTLTDLASKKFTFEWLSKSSPINFILGKLCNCCAHLNGMGYGLMYASIVHPDFQTLVIKNNKGEIIAKSTLYLNREQGYGVCNNVEVNEKMKKKDKEIIYLKFKAAVYSFAEKYNKENKDNPIKIITVGMQDNDLGKQIETNDIKSLILYDNIDFSRYNKQKDDFIGNSRESQYIVWEGREK